MCPRLHLPGHVVATGRPVCHSLAIDGGDNRSIDISKLVSRHGGQCLPLLESRLYGTDKTGSVSAGSAC